MQVIVVPIVVAMRVLVAVTSTSAALIDPPVTVASVSPSRVVTATVAPAAPGANPPAAP